LAVPPKVSLAVANKHPVDVVLMALITPADQWPRQPEVLNDLNKNLLAMTGLLAQLKLAQGSVSVSAFDTVDGKTAYEQRRFAELNWAALADTLSNAAEDQISVTALKDVRERSTRLRQGLTQELNRPGGPFAS
jgi:hypothetical protein